MGQGGVPSSFFSQAQGDLRPNATRMEASHRVVNYPSCLGWGGHRQKTRVHKVEVVVVVESCLIDPETVGCGYGLHGVEARLYPAFRYSSPYDEHRGGTSPPRLRKRPHRSAAVMQTPILTHMHHGSAPAARSTKPHSIISS